MNTSSVRNKIKVLPQDLTNRIAAGEVIERPASVVKELVENAIDAGSDQIKVIIKDGGKSLIQVVDNGSGMSREDAVLSFQRHTTSKISNYQDLHSIRTLGFRGEALASIASISRVEMRTVIQGTTEGTLLRIAGGVVETVERAAGTRGTSIAVKNMFYNVPARRKFLKSDTAEYRQILAVMNRFTLAFYEIGFTLINGEQKVFDLKPTSPENRIHDVLGARSQKNMIQVQDESSFMRIWGYVGNRDAIRKSRGDQYLFLNDRYIINRPLNHAVISAYGEILPRGEFPIYVIFLEVEPQRVDVNVHPSKLEVKFADEKLVYDLLRGAVKRALNSAQVIPNIQPSGRRDLEEFVPVSQPPAGIQARFPAVEFVPQPQSLARPQSEAERESILVEGGKESAKESKLERTNIWQLHNQYILSQTKKGLLIIDQHVAHERILYERALKSFEQRTPAPQQLLFPQVVDLAPEDYSYMMEILPFLERIGFIVKPFGGNAVVMEGVPSGLKIGNNEKILLEIIDDYKKTRTDSLDIRETVAKSFACRLAIKAGEKLTLEAMNSLLDQLFATQSPYFCPHGRPIIITISLDELNRRFGR